MLNLNPTFLVLMLLSLVSCSNSQERSSRDWQNRAEKYVEKWNEKKMKVPTDLIVVHSDTSFSLHNSNLLKAPLKLITFIDADCGVCLEDLDYWKEFYNGTHKNSNYQMLVFINAKDKESFNNNVIEEMNIPFPWILDQNSQFIKLNDLGDKRFYTALLDEENKVILIGTPTLNPELEKLYKETITERSFIR